MNSETDAGVQMSLDGSFDSMQVLEGTVTFDPAQPIESEDVFVVERIVSHRRKKDGLLQYLIKWEGFGPEQNSWEDANDVYATELIKNYWEDRRKKREPENSESRSANNSVVTGEDQSVTISLNNDITSFSVGDINEALLDSSQDVPRWIRGVAELQVDDRQNPQTIDDDPTGNQRQVSQDDWETNATIGNVFVDDDTGELVVWINWFESF
ncbi:10892_t:CDS:2 [Acaulospora colombiana]|uniref:10892_t:CDS:1 n=1 Tax=Acaulospora colombiana TaxID=27376 RepID=A0ACA9N3Z9_9GLOM|nr:10892_t:CDS:2 [Acaulospora colombiana]